MKKTLVIAAVCMGMYLNALGQNALGQNALGQSAFGIVKYSVNFMRNAPDYESGVETQALMGSVVRILDKNGYWLQIESLQPEYVAWATEMGVVPVDSLQAQEYIRAPKYICTAKWSEVFSGPSEDSGRISDLVLGDLLRVRLADNGKALKKKGFLGVTFPDGREAYVRKGDVALFKDWAASRSATQENIVATAKEFLGTPYFWGGISPKGFDCSGLTSAVYFQNGVLLRRNASQQVKEGIAVSLEGFEPGVSEGDLQPSDLMFFGRHTDSGDRVTHVAIYIGGGCIIHSSHEVRVNSLNPAAENYYNNTPRLLCVRRICDADGKPYTSLRVEDSPYYF